MNSYQRVRAFQIELEFGSVGFWGKGKTGVPLRKTTRSKGENQQQTRPIHGVDAGIWTRATLEGGECSHHCATLALLTFYGPPSPEPRNILPEYKYFSFCLNLDWVLFQTFIHYSRDSSCIQYSCYYGVAYLKTTRSTTATKPPLSYVHLFACSTVCDFYFSFLL